MTTGIYAVVNALEETICYIGKSKNIERRWRHVICELRKGEFRGKLLQEDFNNFGEICLKLVILEEVAESNLSERETYWIKLHQPEGNVMGTPAYDAIRESVRAIMREKSKGNTSHLGHTLSEETRRKLSEALKGREAWNKGKVMDEAYRQRVSSKLKGNKNRANSVTSPEAKARLKAYANTPEERESRRLRAIAQWKKQKEQNPGTNSL